MNEPSLHEILEELKALRLKVDKLTTEVKELRERLDIRDFDEEREMWADRERRERGA